MDKFICSKCNKSLAADQFYYQKTGSRAGRRFSWCKDCQSKRMNKWYKRNPQKSLEAGRIWREKNPEKMEALRLKRYGITLEDFGEMLESQGGCCAICRNPPTPGKKFNVDHDHNCCEGSSQSCGDCVRGLLCQSCNHLIGFAKDDPEILRNALQYVGVR